MAKVNICSVEVLENPSGFNTPFKFKITIECLEELKEDLEWKLIYVGSAETPKHDQELDCVLVGPLACGISQFLFEAPAPDPTRIPDSDAIGVTVILLTCSYRDKEFIRVGYYVSVEYSDLQLQEEPPAKPDFTKVVRNIISDHPRVTRFKIDWGDRVGGDDGEVGGGLATGADNGENRHGEQMVVDGVPTTGGEESKSRLDSLMQGDARFDMSSAEVDSRPPLTAVPAN